tara:strand:- start:6668 stop:8308 length:1641 start_codon:yes stop_codon:yes gene_type:complete
MEQYKVLKNLFDNHYKQFIVTSAIAPHTEYTKYSKKIELDASTVVCAFGDASGQIISRDAATHIYVNNAGNLDLYYAQTKDVFIEGQVTHSKKPSDYLICIDSQHNLIHSSELIHCVSDTWWTEDNAVLLSTNWYDEDEYAYTQHTKYSEYEGAYILDMHAILCRSDNAYYHQDSECLWYSDIHDYYVNREDDNVVYCVDTEDYVLDEHAHYYEAQDCWFSEKPIQRDVINEYHCGIEPEFYTTPINHSNELTKYTIGFEVEKNDVDEYSGTGYGIEEQPLFSHWETDGSCGVEGITNVYSLDNLSRFSSHVKDSWYVNEDTNNSCGGHINIAHRQDKMEYWHIRPWLGLVYSMWRKRLRNQYSSGNKKLSPYSSRNGRYSVLVEKGHSPNRRYELRLPSRVINGNQLDLRFRLMQQLFHSVDKYINEDFSYTKVSYDDFLVGLPDWAWDNCDDTNQEKLPIEPKGSIISSYHAELFEKIIKTIEPNTLHRMRYLIQASKHVLLDCYSSLEKVQNVIAYAYMFQHYIDNNQDTKDFHNHIGEYTHN